MVDLTAHFKICSCAFGFNFWFLLTCALEHTLINHFRKLFHGKKKKVINCFDSLFNSP